MAGYGQFCPVSKAMEVLDERWTLLVVRELLAGSRRFNELRRGNPRMSPSLLTKRLRTLERAGIVRRDLVGSHASYTLTPCGEELRPVVDALGDWGIRWTSELGEADLDPHLLMYDIKRSMPADAWPATRTVVAIELDDVAPRVARWWLVVSGGEADVCDHDPGFEADATLRIGLATLTALWRGDVSWRGALAGGKAVVEGGPTIRRGLPDWIGQSKFAAVPRVV